MRTALLLLAATLLGTASSGRATAQTTAPAPAPERQAARPEDQVFFAALDVHVVNVEVFVTDRDGNAVTGLTAADFELYEDGRPVPITNFYAVEDRQRQDEPVPPVEPPPAPPAPAPPVPVAPRVEVPEDQRLHLVVYFDNLQLRPFDRNRLLREARAFLLEHLEPGDRVMVVSFERSLNVRQPFTENLEDAARALAGLEKLTGFAAQAATERDRVLRRLEQIKELVHAEPLVTAYAEQTFRDLEDSIEGLKNVIGSLGGLPGRKALLYVSNGLPMTAGEDLYYLIDQRWGETATGGLWASRYSARSDFRELVAHANANRVTLYTVDASGLGGHRSLSAASGGTQEGGSLIELDHVHEANLTEPLQMMARDTGGQSFFNTNNFTGALGKVAGDLGSYYSLGYTPAEHGEGRYHRLRVEVKRRGVEVRHRNGYRDQTVEARLGDGALASLLHGAERDRLGLTIRFGTPKPRSDSYYLVPVEVGIPLGAVTLVPQGELHRGRLRVVVSVADREGETSPPEQVAIPLEVPTAQLQTARTQSFVYAAELLMRRGTHDVAVGVRDELAGETSYARRTVRVGQ